MRRTPEIERAHPVLLTLLIAVVPLALTPQLVQANRADMVSAWLEILVFTGAIGLLLMVTGSTILLRAGWNPTGWPLIGVGVVLMSFSGFESLVATSYARWLLDDWMVTALFSLLAYTALVFPTGQLPRESRLSARLARGAIAVLVSAVVVITASFPGSIVPPLLGGISNAMTFLILGVAVVSLVVRFSRSRGEQRAQLSWVLAAIGLLTAILIGTFVAVQGFGANEDVYALSVVGIAAVPASIFVAILRYRLYEIDRLVSRTVTYISGELTGVVAKTMQPDSASVWIRGER